MNRHRSQGGLNAIKAGFALLVALLIWAAINSIWPKAFASTPVREDMEDAARKACADRGLTLRALVIYYDEQAEPTGGRVVCGPPKRQDV